MSPSLPLFHDSPAEAALWCAAQRSAGRSLGFVPTMGALHEGHVALVERSRSECERTCVSIFVNPLQFDDPRDLERYPRDLAADRRRLAGSGCDMLFTGTLAGFFPGRLDADGRLPRDELLDPGPAAGGLEGEARPGHFAGVATICARLFDLVEPTRAYFGEKDYQQCLVVRDLARGRGAPQIVVHPTMREASGLACSSRNALLTSDERERAPALYRALTRTREAWRAGVRSPSQLARGLRAELERAGFEVEYAALRDPLSWSAGEPSEPLQRAVALVAARLGAVRLIDNLRLDGAAATAAQPLP